MISRVASVSTNANFIACFAAATAFGICLLGVGCRKLAPEKQKRQTPAVVFRILGAGITHDLDSDAIEYSSTIDLRLESDAGSYTKLGQGESLLVNGVQPTLTGAVDFPFYRMEGSGTPPAEFTFLWTTASGNFEKVCPAGDFVNSEIPATVSRSSGMTITIDVTGKTGSFYGDFYAKSSSDGNIISSTQQGYLSGTPVAGATTLSLVFTPAILAKVAAGENFFFLTWSQYDNFSQAGTAGGRCSVSYAKKKLVNVN